MNGRALGIQLTDDRLGDLARDEVDERLLAAERLGEPRQRGVGAHAAGVRAGVAVAEALEVLGGAQRQHVVAVAEEEQRDLGAGEELLDQHRLRSAGTRRRGRAPHRGRRSRARPCRRPGRRPSRRTARRARRAPPRPRRRVVARTARPVGTPAASMIRFANAFDPSSWAAARPGPNTGMPRSRSASATPATSGASGPIDDEVDGVLVRELGDRRRSRSGRGRRSSRPGRSRRCRGRRRPRAGVLRAQREDDGVLARARAEDQDSHPPAYRAASPSPRAAPSGGTIGSWQPGAVIPPARASTMSTSSTRRSCPSSCTPRPATAGSSASESRPASSSRVALTFLSALAGEPGGPLSTGAAGVLRVFAIYAAVCVGIGLAVMGTLAIVLDRRRSSVPAPRTPSTRRPS